MAIVDSRALFNKIKRAIHDKIKIFKSYLPVIIETFRLTLKLFFETGQLILFEIIVVFIGNNRFIE